MRVIAGQCRNPDQMFDVLSAAGWDTTTDTKALYVFTLAGELVRGHDVAGWHRDAYCGEWIAVWVNTDPTEFPDRRVAPFDVVVFDREQQHRLPQQPATKDRLFVRMTHLVRRTEPVTEGNTQ